MSQTRNKIKKKKEREKEVRKKILKRREKIRMETKEEKEKVKEERDNERVVNKHTGTICYNKNGRMSEEEIREKLEKNMEILKALEEEYDRLQISREENIKNIQNIQEEKKNMAGEADVVFKPNE